MKLFTLTRKAKDDLRHIANYTFKVWGIDQRDHYLKELNNAFTLLAEKPELARPCDHIRTGYRQFLHGSHIIFFHQPDHHGIRIIRILHKSMNIATHLPL